ncbi:dynamin family protein [Shewanella sp. 125m-1]
MKLKQKIEDLLPKIRVLSSVHGFDNEFDDAIQKHNQFKLRAPLVGAFSAGKSTLINTLLGEKLLSVEVTPETCLPTELIYSKQEYIHLMNKNEKVLDLTRAQLKDQEYLLSLQGNTNEEAACFWIEMGFSHPRLEQNKDLVLVDMPGWGSGISEHSLAIDNYIQSSGAYCIVVEATDGTIRESIQQALIELKLFNKPVVLIITKADKISSDELPNVVEHITKTVTQYLDVSPLAVVTTAARKKRINGFEEALTKIVEQSDNIYRNMVLTDFYALFNRMKAKLTIVLNEDNLTVEQAQSACDAIPEALAELKQQLTELEHQIDEIIPSCVESAKANLRNNLKSQLDSIASSAINGGNFQSQVTNALRNAYLTTVEQDFKPKVSRQLKSLQNISDIAPSNVNIVNSFSVSESEGGQFVFTQVISAVLTKVIMLVPVLKPFAPIVYALASIFTNKLDKEKQREEQKEEAKQYVLNTLIPQVIAQVEPALLSNFNEMVLKVKKEVTEESERKAADKKQALLELQRTLSQAKEEDAKQKQQYKDALNQLIDFEVQLQRGKHNDESN